MKKKYDLETKLKICKEHAEHGMGEKKIEKEYGIPRSTVRKWFKKYELGGVEELKKNNTGKSSKKGINKKHFSSVEEELTYVKAERDILKKTLEILKL